MQQMAAVPSTCCILHVKSLTGLSSTLKECLGLRNLSCDNRSEDSIALHFSSLTSLVDRHLSHTLIMDDIGYVDHNEHQKVMDGFGAQIGRLDRKLHALRDRLIAAGDAVTVDSLSDERAATKKQKAEIEKLQQVAFPSNSLLIQLAKCSPGRAGKL